MDEDVSDDVCDSWEDMIENGILEKKLEELQFKSPKINSPSEEEPRPETIQLIPQMRLEDNSRTPYAPQVKILRRPNAAKAVVCEKSPSRQPVKTLQQREAEYAEARLRILGSAHSEEEQSPTSTNSVTIDSHERTEAELIVTRMPKGPDGSNGFMEQR